MFMRLLYPLRPLTHSGRVAIGVAVAVFAAILLIAWSPSPHDAITLTSAGAAR
jgi:hypothetical protein